MKIQAKNIYKKISILLTSLILVTVLTGCKDIVKNMNTKMQAEGEYPVMINGVEVKSAPQKAVVLSASLTDVIIELRQTAQLAGVIQDATQSDVENLPKVTADDIEGIKALQPDLLLASSLSDETRTALQALNVPIVEIAPATGREDYERLFGQVSSVFAGGGSGYDKGVTAAQEIFVIMDSLQRLTNTNETKATVRACYLYDLGGTFVTDKDFAAVIMQYSGLTNIFPSQTDETSDKWYEKKLPKSDVFVENLKNMNPDFIFCAPGLEEELKNDPVLSNLNAVKNNHVLEMDPTYMQWQGRTIVTASTKMIEFAFPELKEEQSAAPIDPTKEIEEKAEQNLNARNSVSYAELQIGDEGDEVLALQEQLAKLKYLTVDTYDGQYGSLTEEAVKAFQNANGLEATGIADSETQRLLFAAKDSVASADDSNSTAPDKNPDMSQSPANDVDTTSENDSAE